MIESILFVKKKAPAIGRLFLFWILITYLSYVILISYLQPSAFCSGRSFILLLPP